MRVALTGASGFIGSNIARTLHAAGHQVIAGVRSTSRLDHIEPFVDRFAVGDQADESTWPDLLEGADCVIHNSFDWESLRSGDMTAHFQSNLVASIRIIEAAAPRRFIYMSSVAVHHEISPAWQGVIDEDHPLRPASVYGACKAAVEGHLWSAHVRHNMPFAILRPCAVYGVDPNLERSIGYPIVEQVRRGEPFSRRGGGKFVHVEDVAAATVACVDRPPADSFVVNLADCYARWADWAKIAADTLGVDMEIDFSTPPRSKNVFSKDSARSLGVDLNRGHDGIRQHLKEVIRMTDGNGGATLAAASRVL